MGGTNKQLVLTHTGILYIYIYFVLLVFNENWTVCTNMIPKLIVTYNQGKMVQNVTSSINAILYVLYIFFSIVMTSVMDKDTSLFDQAFKIINTMRPNQNSWHFATFSTAFSWTKILWAEFLVGFGPGPLNQRHLWLFEAEWCIYTSVISPSLVQTMACRLFSAEPLSQLMLEYC